MLNLHFLCKKVGFHCIFCEEGVQIPLFLQLRYEYNYLIR